MSNKSYDISDLSNLKGVAGGAAVLPMRSEKQLVFWDSEYKDKSVYDISAALSQYTDYIHISIPGRGGQTGVYDSDSSAVYRFLINPKTCEIPRTAQSEQSFSRGGWQNGVKGEDFINLSFSGTTPGRYFEQGLAGTNLYTPLTVSYRNLLALEVAFENNGYWFEGEQVTGQAIRQIKRHQDVEIGVGEFIWTGAFESMTISETAERPFLADFTINFTAWRERFRQDSPYPDSLYGAVQKGHTTYSIKSTTSSSSISYESTPPAFDLSTLESPANVSTLPLVDQIINPLGQGFGQ